MSILHFFNLINPFWILFDIALLSCVVHHFMRNPITRDRWFGRTPHALSLGYDVDQKKYLMIKREKEKGTEVWRIPKSTVETSISDAADTMFIQYLGIARSFYRKIYSVNLGWIRGTKNSAKKLTIDSMHLLSGQGMGINLVFLKLNTKTHPLKFSLGLDIAAAEFVAYQELVRRLQAAAEYDGVDFTWRGNTPPLFSFMLAKCFVWRLDFFSNFKNQLKLYWHKKAMRMYYLKMFKALEEHQVFINA